MDRRKFIKNSLIGASGILCGGIVTQTMSNIFLLNKRSPGDWRTFGTIALPSKVGSLLNAGADKFSLYLVGASAAGVLNGIQPKMAHIVASTTDYDQVREALLPFADNAIPSFNLGPNWFRLQLDDTFCVIEAIPLDVWRSRISSRQASGQPVFAHSTVICDVQKGKYLDECGAVGGPLKLVGKVISPLAAYQALQAGTIDAKLLNLEWSDLRLALFDVLDQSKPSASAESIIAISLIDILPDADRIGCLPEMLALLNSKTVQVAFKNAINCDTVQIEANIAEISKTAPGVDSPAVIAIAAIAKSCGKPSSRNTVATMIEQRYINALMAPKNFGALHAGLGLASSLA